MLLVVLFGQDLLGGTRLVLDRRLREALLQIVDLNFGDVVRVYACSFRKKTAFIPTGTNAAASVVPPNLG